MDLGFSAHSYVWLPSITDCCITFCTNATSKGMVGWLCSQRKQPKSSDAFSRVYVWCHQKHEKANAICIGEFAYAQGLSGESGLTD